MHYIWLQERNCVQEILKQNSCPFMGFEKWSELIGLLPLFSSLSTDHQSVPESQAITEPLDKNTLMTYYRLFWVSHKRTFLPSHLSLHDDFLIPMPSV